MISTPSAARITNARRPSFAVPSGTSVVAVTPSFFQKGMTGSIRSTTRTGVALRIMVTEDLLDRFAASQRRGGNGFVSQLQVTLEGSHVTVLKKSGAVHLARSPLGGRQTSKRAA